MITILLVDDQPLVRQGWKMRLALEEDMAVVGEAGDGREAVDLAEKLAPQVVVMDVDMPIMDGIAAATALCAKKPVVVVMMSIHDDPETRNRSLAAGASAFVSKQEPFEAALVAIRKANATLKQ